MRHSLGIFLLLSTTALGGCNRAPAQASESVPATQAAASVPSLPAATADLRAAPSGAAAAQASVSAPACTLATKGDSPVAKACRQGGEPAAKATMKDLVKRAGQAGTKFQCDDCHKDPEDRAKLAPDAREKFKKLLAAAGA